MKSESFVGNIPPDDLNRRIDVDGNNVPDYSKLPEKESNEISQNSDEAEKITLAHLEEHLADSYQLLQDKLAELQGELSSEMSNGKKVELQDDIEAVQAELDAYAIEGAQSLDDQGVLVSETAEVERGYENMNVIPKRTREGLMDDIGYRSLQIQNKLKGDVSSKEGKEALENLRKEQETDHKELSELEDAFRDQNPIEQQVGQYQTMRSLKNDLRSAEKEARRLKELEVTRERDQKFSKMAMEQPVVPAWAEELGGQSAERSEKIPAAESAQAEKDPDVIDLDPSQWYEVKSLENKSAEGAGAAPEEGTSPIMEGVPAQREPFTFQKDAEGDFIDLDPSQWRRVDEGPEKQPEKTEPSEHWQLKRAMKEAKSEYLSKLDAAAKERGTLSKMFGFGRQKMTPEVQAAYDTFMETNKAYYQHAKESGRYDKLDEWYKKRRSANGGIGEMESIYGAVTERHVFQPAKERLALQERQMPPALQKLLGKIAGNKKLKWGLMGASIVATAGAAGAGILAGKLTRWGLTHTYVKGKEDAHDHDFESINNLIRAGKDVDLDALEKQYYASALAIDTAKVRTNLAGVAVGAAATAGAGYSIGNEIFSGDTPDVEVVDPMYRQVSAEGVPEVEPTPFDSVTPVEAEPTVPSAEQVTTAPDVAIEKTFTIESGDTVSKALYEGIKSRVEAGVLKLPPGVTPETISHHIYQSFPEMTNATGAAARLTPQEWIELGVSSGDPHQIAAGEVIDVQGLIDRMSGTTSMEVSSAPEASYMSPIEDQDIAAVDGNLDEVVQSMSGKEAAEMPPVKYIIGKNGEVRFDLPKELYEGTAHHVNPFAEEMPHVTAVPNENLLDLMMERINERVEAGQIRFDSGMTQSQLRELLLERLPELKEPDEVLWFQHKATPGLSDAAWQRAGIPGNPLDIPPGTQIDMEYLLNKVMGYDPSATESVLDRVTTTSVSEVSPESPEIAVEQPAPTVPEATTSPNGAEVSAGETRVTDDTVFMSKESIMASRGDLNSAYALEKMQGYQPQMSPELIKSVYTVKEGVGQGQFAEALYQRTLEAYRAGEANLPAETMLRIEANPAAVNAFVDTNAAEFSEFNPFIAKYNLELSRAEWKELGFSSGDPRVVTPGDTIQMGKLIKLTLENAAERINSKFH